MHAPDSGSSQKLDVNVYCVSLTSALGTVDDLFDDLLASCTQYKSYEHEQLRVENVVNMICLYFTIILHYRDVWWVGHDVLSTQ